MIKKSKQIVHPGAPGTHIINSPDLVHLQFERRRARQLIKLIDQNSTGSWRYQAPSARAGALSNGGQPSWGQSSRVG